MSEQNLGPVHQFAGPAELYASLIEASPDAIVTVAVDGRLTFASPRALEMFRFHSLQEVIGMDTYGLIDPEHRERTRANLAGVLAGEPIENNRYLLIRRDGTRFWGEATGSVLRDPGGTPTGIVIVIRDITSRQMDEEALLLSEEKFADAFKISPDSLSINRFSDGVFVDVNDGFTRITGYSAREVIGRSSLPGDLSLWVDVEDRRRLFTELEKNGEAHDLEGKFRTKSGELRTGTMSAKVMTVRGEKCVLSVTRDITEAKRTGEVLQNAQRLEAIGILAGGIAHDFNNLLTGIYGHLELALELCRKKIYTGVPAVLTEALSSYDRARDLTQQLLTFAKGGLPFTRVEDVAVLVRDTVGFALSGSNVNVEFHLAEDLRPCEVDRNQFAQMLDNIVINAKQAMPSGGRLEVSARNLDAEASRPFGVGAREHVCISFTDQGPGIPREIMPRIFDPFFSTKPEGTGLGLSISHSIARKHGGALVAESEPGRGAVFHVLLPAALGTVPKSPESRQEIPRGAGRVLVMDDEKAVRDVLCKMLELLGYEAVGVGGENQAIVVLKERLAARQPFILAILDLTIPGEQGGYHTLQELKALDPDLKVIVSSGYFEGSEPTGAAAKGVCAKIVKPFTRNELSKAIAECLEM